MKSVRSSVTNVSAKAPTGIIGLDQITGGGLPYGRTTLLMGGPGSGKTILSLQILAHGAQNCKEPGIFVAFEEAPQRIITNAQSFGWSLAELQNKKKLFFLNAQPMLDLILSGNFDLSGMLASVGAKAKEMGARRIVFDALDVVLELLPDAAAKRRELYRLHEWLLSSELTGFITAKIAENDTNFCGPHGFMQFMMDCAVVLSHRVELGVSQRNLRVQKYRGSAFDENESPFVIGKTGFDVAIARTMGHQDVKVTSERVTSGVARLDTMLGGGYYRGATVLITGVPGTAKTTLSGTFAEAACQRGEQTLFVSFDSDGTEVARNLASVGIRLRPHVKSGCLCMVSARTFSGSAETKLVRIKSLAKERGARCVVIDPVSTLAKSSNDITASSVVERLIDWSKSEGITLICTSLQGEKSTYSEIDSHLHISTLADTWIHLNFLAQAGERNRGMAIIKSRGTAHSNQVRELILSNAGVTLADTYSAEGEVLMGTMRWQKESTERVASEAADVAAKFKRVMLEAEEVELKGRLKSLEAELLAKQSEKELLASTTGIRERELVLRHTHMREMRSADDTHLEKK